MKSINRPLWVIVAILLVCILVDGLSQKPWEYEFEYLRLEEQARSVTIHGNPNVRSEPIVSDDSISASTTSYGEFRCKKPSFAMDVAVVYRERKNQSDHDPLDACNGYYVGLKVSDIRSHFGWRRHFPRSIVKDPDGIVWIQCDYITVIR